MPENVHYMYMCDWFPFPALILSFISLPNTPLGFSDSSVCKESSWNAGDAGFIPKSEISAQERIDYPLQYSWGSPVASLVKNLPEMWQTWVWSLGWDDLLEKEMATRANTLAWRIPWTEEPGRLQSMGSQRVRYNWSDLATKVLACKSDKIQH